MSLPTFQVPLTLHELEESSDDQGIFRVQDAPKLDLADTSGLQRSLEGVGSKLLRRDGIEGLSENESFDVLYAFVRTFPTLPGNIQGRLLDILGRSVRAASAHFRTSQQASEDENNDAAEDLDLSRLRSNALKMATFLLVTAITSAETSHVAGKNAEGPKKKGASAAAKKSKKKAKRRSDGSDDDDDDDDDSDEEGGGSRRARGGGKSKSFEWSTQRESSVGALADVLSSVDMSRLWTMGVPDERFMNLFCRTAFQMLEQPLTAGVLRQSVLRLLAVPLQLVSSSAGSGDGSTTLETQVVATLMHLLSSKEHVVAPLVDLCRMTASANSELSSASPASTRFAVSVLREAVRVDTSSSAHAGPGLKHLGLFLVELSTQMPALVMHNMSSVLPLLDAEPYGLRSSVATAIAQVVAGTTRNATAEGAGEEQAGPSGDGGGGDALACFAATRDSLLNVLTERAHDVNSFTRAAVVRSWAMLAESRALPLARIHSVGLLALDRLGDKNQVVRKAAIQLLVNLLEYNPFMQTLDPTLYEAKELEVAVWLQENPLPEDAKAAAKQEAKERCAAEKKAAAAAAASIAEGDEDSQDEAKDEDSGGDADEDEDEDGDEEGDEDAATVELRAQRARKYRELDFFKSAGAFIALLEGAAPQLEALLRSKSAADAVEALRFFAAASHFQVPCASKGLRASWALVWSPDAAVVEEVQKAFLQVHACEAGAECDPFQASAKQRLSPGRVATNLTNVVSLASAAERTCLEELLKDLVEKGRLGGSVFAALRKGCTEAPTLAKRALAMQVLAMCCSANQEKAAAAAGDAAAAAATTATVLSVMGGEKQLLSLAEATLGADGGGVVDGGEGAQAVDWELVRCACLAFKRVASKRNKAQQLQPNSGKGGGAAWEVLVLKQCVSILRGDRCDDLAEEGKQDGLSAGSASRWFAAAEEAMGCVFALSPQPEAVCAAVITAVHAKTLGKSDGQCHPVALARLCHVLGGSALGLLVYTEAKAAQLKKVLQIQATKVEKKKSKGEGSQQAGGEEEDEEEDEEFRREAELGMAAEAELEHDQRVTAVVEGEVAAQGLLAAFEPLLLSIVANEAGQFDNEVLRQAATLALTKYMCVSSAACERHLPLLFTCLQREPWPSVRGNVMVALGDLAFRFPNAVEPWTSQLYRRLRDDDSAVRGQTLMVLTHLILNDMVKVKGQVAEMVLSLEDPHAPTADLAKLFFQELSKRGNNPVYNLLPDIVSRLSQDSAVSRDTFRRVMPFLMSFITKDKHSESLAEKLCFRFATCDSMAQTQDLAFCLAQLPVNDKALKKLDALVKTYHSALFDDEVFKSFTSLVSKAKKFAKPEMRDAVNEYAAKIASIHNGAGGGVPAGAATTECDGDNTNVVGSTEEGVISERKEAENQLEDKEDGGDEASPGCKKEGRRTSSTPGKKEALADKENTQTRRISRSAVVRR